MYILECHTIRLPIRQRIIDLFEKGVMRRIVLEEDEDGYDEYGDESGESQPATARPPDTSKTIRPPDAARASPQKLRSPDARSEGLRSPEAISPGPARTPATSRPRLGRQWSGDGG